MVITCICKLLKVQFINLIMVILCIQYKVKIIGNISRIKTFMKQDQLFLLMLLYYLNNNITKILIVRVFFRNGGGNIPEIYVYIHVSSSILTSRVL